MKISKALGPKFQETDETTRDQRTINLPRTRICSLEELVEYCQIDLEVWEVERFICNKWEVGVKKGEGEDSRVEVEPLFQVKAFLRRRKDLQQIKQEIEQLKELAKQFPWVKPKKSLRRCNSGLMLEINIPDLHSGKLAWGVETGGPNYDVKLAEETFWNALDTLLSRVSGYTFEEVLFVVGNDLFNSDDVEGRTTSGTYVSTDARYHKTFASTRTMIIQAIQRLKEIAPVKVIPVYGNHDRLSSWHLADSIEMFFWNDDSVTVDNRPRARKYYNFGKVMLMFTHGDKGKRTDYPLVMATEEPEMFGRTVHRECHTGHTHMTKLDEQHGVRVRVLPALCPADDWHSQNFFIGNKRCAEAYIWSKEEGLISIVFHTENN